MAIAENSPSGHNDSVMHNYSEHQDSRAFVLVFRCPFLLPNTLKTLVLAVQCLSFVIPAQASNEPTPAFFLAVALTDEQSQGEEEDESESEGRVDSQWGYFATLNSLRQKRQGAGLPKQRNIELGASIEAEIELLDGLSGIFGASLVTESERLSSPRYSSFEYEKDEFLELDELALLLEFENSIAAGFVAGLTELSEARSWWQDETLLGLSVNAAMSNFYLDLSAATLANNTTTLHEFKDPEEQDLYWYNGILGYQYGEENRISLELTHLDDQSGAHTIGAQIAEDRIDELDDSVIWVGGSLAHKFSDFFGGSLSLSFTGAVLDGRRDQTLFSGESAQDTDSDEDDSDDDENEEADDDSPEFDTVAGLNRQSLSGWGFNLRADWQPIKNGSMIVSFGYAQGSGSTYAEDSNRSGTFFQTGQHSNSVEINGLDFNYYGNLTEPALSNLGVLTLMMSAKISRFGTAGIQFNRYQRLSLNDQSSSLELDIEPDSASTGLGWEASLLYHYEWQEGLAIDARVSRFETGNAFSGAGSSVLTGFEISIEHAF